MEFLARETAQWGAAPAAQTLGWVTFQGVSSSSVYFQFKYHRILYLWDIGDNFKGHSTARNRAPMRHLFKQTLSKALEKKIKYRPLFPPSPAVYCNKEAQRVLFPQSQCKSRLLTCLRAP